MDEDWLEGPGAPEEESDYWEDDGLTPRELARWFSAAHEAEARDAGRAAVAGPCPVAEGGVPDLIAAVLAAGGEPALMTDAELAESLAAWHAVASRAAGRELRATVELLRRRKPRGWDRRSERAERAREDADGSAPGCGAVPERVMPAVAASREAAAEIALALTATEYSAGVQAELAAVLSRRLPGAFCELDAGRADLMRVRVLAEAVQFLGDEDAGKVDALLAPQLGQLTTGELRDRARKAVIRIDVKAADRRRERAERKARFALYANEDQTATAAVERMPAHLGAAVRARVNAIARAARAAGMTGPLPLIEARVATGLLLDTLPQIPPPDGGAAGGPGPGGPPQPGPEAGPWDDGWPADWFTRPPAGTADDDGDDGDGGGSSGTAGDGTFGHDGSSRDETGPEETGSDETGSDETGPRGPGRDSPGPGDPDLADFGTPGTGSAAPGPDCAAMSWPPIPAQAGAAAPGCPGLPSWLMPKEQGRIRLLVPWRTLAGTGPEPGELSWIGPVPRTRRARSPPPPPAIRAVPGG